MNLSQVLATLVLLGSLGVYYKDSVITKLQSLTSWFRKPESNPEDPSNQDFDLFTSLWNMRQRLIQNGRTDEAAKLTDILVSLAQKPIEAPSDE